MTDAIVIITNVPDEDTADKIAHGLVERRLAACVNVLPPVSSIYRWQGAVEEAAEITLLIKTTHDLYEIAEAAIVEMHPYEVPEVIMLPVLKGLPSYLKWIEAETKAEQ